MTCACPEVDQVPPASAVFPVKRRLGIDLHPHPMDGDMVVIPTKGDEVVGVMAPTAGTGMDVVDL